MDPLKSQTATATPAEPGGLLCLARGRTRGSRSAIPALWPKPFTACPDDVAKRARAHLTDDLRRVVARFEESVARLRYAERHGRWSPEGV